MTTALGLEACLLLLLGLIFGFADVNRGGSIGLALGAIVLAFVVVYFLAARCLKMKMSRTPVLFLIVVLILLSSISFVGSPFLLIAVYSSASAGAFLAINFHLIEEQKSKRGR
jgi:uncharacterized membrane protein